MPDENEEFVANIHALTESIRQLDRSNRELGVKIEALNAKMEATYVRKDIYERDLGDLKEDVDKSASKSDVHTLKQTVEKHSDYFDWIVKLVGGAVILALLALVLVQNGGKF